MDVSLVDLRIAALINLYEVTENTSHNNELLEFISNELWCLRNGVSTEGLEDVTLHDTSTSGILKVVQEYTHRTPEEQSAMLVCTLREIS
jgi:cob(I)alamin adenosyltransferase